MNNGPEDAACGGAKDYVKSIKNHEKNQTYTMEWEKVRMEHVALTWPDEVMRRGGRPWNGRQRMNRSGPSIGWRSTTGSGGRRARGHDG